MLNIRLERGEFRDVENGEWWMGILLRATDY
jgi:hypothetical protein